ncbi:hypothetical protein TeGR_g1836 [Tetraparma gracilis]|uniref:Uncharacterized protein n=1 Tax=Tetraparma gracilis TaxID=2962635 RepID=A0ABQ6MYL8_9STRA|nr:hypothetical protein TeGR_g1836 [Tetraparma gracilis]
MTEEERAAMPAYDSRLAPSSLGTEEMALQKKLQTSKYFIPSLSKAEEERRDWAAKKQTLYQQQKFARFEEAMKR